MRTERRGFYRHFLSLPDSWRELLCPKDRGIDIAPLIACLDWAVSHFLATELTRSAEVQQAPHEALHTFSFESFEACGRLHPLADFPTQIEIGMRVPEMNDYAIRFELALFSADAPPCEVDKPIASGSVVKTLLPATTTFPATRSKPLRIPPTLRLSLARLLVEQR